MPSTQTTTHPQCIGLGLAEAPADPRGERQAGAIGEHGALHQHHSARGNPPAPCCWQCQCEADGELPWSLALAGGVAGSEQAGGQRAQACAGVRR